MDERKNGSAEATRTCEALVLRLHDQLSDPAVSEELIKATQGLLDEEWGRMGDVDRRLFAGILHDLKSLRGQELVYRAPDVAVEDANLAGALRLAEDHRWEAMLRTLRSFYPGDSRDHVLGLRCKGWSRLGFTLVAERFNESITNRSRQIELSNEVVSLLNAKLYGNMVARAVFGRVDGCFTVVMESVGNHHGVVGLSYVTEMPRSTAQSRMLFDILVNLVTKNSSF